MGKWLDEVRSGGVKDTRLTRLVNTLMHIFHLFSSDRERITSLLDLRITCLPLKHMLPQICHVAVKNQGDFLPVSRDWPADGDRRGITGFVPPCLFSWNSLVVT